MQINRLLEITYILMKKNTVTAAELAERFGVSQRTIYGDIDNLSLAKIPVYTSKGRGGGIRLMEDFVLDKSLLSEDEQSEILSALQGLSAIKTGDAARVLGKLSSIFNREAVSWLEVDFSDWSYQNGDMFQSLKTAILERRVVEFDYYSSYGEKTHRMVEPLQLCFKHRAWYAKGFCLARNGLRMFRLTRMKGLSLTEEGYKARDLLKSMAQSAPEAAHIKRDIRLKLKIAPEMTYRVYDEFDESQLSKHDDGSFTATVTWPEDEWVYGFILSFGEHAQVLEPERLREIIKDKAKKTSKKYE